MPDRYVVTGVAGFIASRVTELLLEKDFEVIGLDNLNDAYDTRLKQWRLQRLQRWPQFRFHPVDICDREALGVLNDNADKIAAVIHLAARAGIRQSIGNPWVYVDTNVTGTLNMLQFCRVAGVPKFVLSSTSSLYGNANSLPYNEDADTTRPLSPYAASKQAAEALCHTFHHLSGLDVSILRYFTVYGAAGRPDMSIFRFVRWIYEGEPIRIYGDGGQSRDFTHVEDIARGTISALRPLGYKVINLGSDRPVALSSLIQTVERLCGRRGKVELLPRNEADAISTWANINRARELLSWSPVVGLEAGLETAVRWYRDHREFACSIALE
ncbi:MAG: NAD-dependent epimerase/dehydratase family protein [Bryobacterales bacterium]|nr:NAD-dependent epimerase/dehydratase family protein [Bryobacterales bacterium]